MKKILLPTDFSKEARNAENFAKQVAKKFNAEILLLHVLEVPYGSFSVMGEVASNPSYEHLYETQLIKATQQRLNELAEGFTSEGITSRAKLVFGNPFISIQETVTDQHMDLVILGSKGASGLSEILVGSNAERVIRHAKCPVITVKGEIDLAMISGIALATDTSLEQDSMVPKLKEFQSLLGFNLHLVRVLTPHNFLSHKDAKNQLKEFAERNQLEDYTTGTIEANFTDEGVIQFALKHDIGMIAMATHGRTGLAHFFGGSIAEDVANHAHIPILTLRV